MNEVTLFGTELAPHVDYKVVKVPELVYQIMYDIAQRDLSYETKQDLVYQQLINWVDEVHPGWGVQNFVDLSSREANQIREDAAKRDVHLPVTWGMYVLLYLSVPHVVRHTSKERIEDNTRKLNE